MGLIDYTSFDDVRAALGVSVDEISDATLSLDLYVFNLVSELETISLTLPADYLTQKATATPWNPVATRFYQMTRLFSAYAVAKQACAALPMFGPKEQADGKSSMVRFAQDPYKVTIARIIEQFEAAKVRLEAAYAATLSLGAPALSTRPYFSVVHPSYDPVLGA